MASNNPRNTIVIIRLPPGVPIMATCLLLSTVNSANVGVMLDSGRLPGAIALAWEPTRPYAFGEPGDAEKSSISLLSNTPVPGTVKPEPKGKLMDRVADT